MTVGRGAWSAAPASRGAAYDNVFCRALAVLALVAANLAFSVEPGSAHKAITSPYTYNDDVFPILRDRCGRCHVNGGVAPMSLLTHAEAVPWGESIRVEVLAGHMPPAGTDGAARFRNAPGLSPREMNVLLTWITGGTPSGTAGKDPKPVAVERTWPLGSPDLALPVPSESIAADAHERTSEFIIATGLTYLQKQYAKPFEEFGEARFIACCLLRQRRPLGGNALELELRAHRSDPLMLQIHGATSSSAS